MGEPSVKARSSYLAAREVRDHVVVETDEAIEFALEDPFLVAVRGEALGTILDVGHRPDTETLHALRAQVRHSVAPVDIVGSVIVL